MIMILASILDLQAIAVTQFQGKLVYEERGCLLHDAPSPRVVPSLNSTHRQQWIAIARAVSLSALIAQSSVFRSLDLARFAPRLQLGLLERFSSNLFHVTEVIA